MVFMRMSASMGFAKDSELIPMFNYYIAKLTEHGQVSSICLFLVRGIKKDRKKYIFEKYFYQS